MADSEIVRSLTEMSRQYGILACKFRDAEAGRLGGEELAREYHQRMELILEQSTLFRDAVKRRTGGA